MMRVVIVMAGSVTAAVAGRVISGMRVFAGM
jgi:hypothetical protein